MTIGPIDPKTTRPTVRPPRSAAEPSPASPVEDMARGTDPAAPTLDQVVNQPWIALPPTLDALAQVRDEVDAQAFALLQAAERKGIWGDGGDSAARGDLALLRHSLPAGASLVDAARGYGRLIEIEARGHSDPTPHARRALLTVAPRLRPGESMTDAAETYGELLRYENGRDIDGSRHACEAFVRIDGLMVESQTRRMATAEYIRDPRTFEPRQSAERERFASRQADMKRVVEQVAREPRTDLKIVPEGEGWIVVGDVRVPRRPA